MAPIVARRLVIAISLTNAYATAAEVMALSRINDTADGAILDTCINAASRSIDRWCGRRFWQDGSVVTREYHADDPYNVEVDDISTTTGLIVKVDSNDNSGYATTLTITTDYLMYPLNAADEVPVRPFTQIRVVAGGSYYFPTGSRPGVQVTAKFGWPAVPDDVKLACILQAQMLYDAKDAKGGLLELVGGSGFASTLPAMHRQAAALLASYVKAEP